MQWNVVPEYLSLVFISILLVYSREYNLIPTLKNKLFRLCLWFVFFEIIISVISILAIENYRVIPVFANQAIQMVFFLASPLMAVLFLFYLIAVVWEDDPKLPAYFRMTAIPYVLYLVLVLTNPATGLLYGIGEPDGLIYGKGFLLVYIIPMSYFLAMFMIILYHRRKMERSLIWILLFLPSISLAMIGFQWIFPTLILSGSAATAALLVVYLYLQNKKIVLDDMTGLQNRKAFSKILELYVKQKWEMDITLISLDDFKLVNDRFGQQNGDNLLKSFSQYLTKIVPIKSIFRFGGDEFILLLDKSIPIPAVDVIETLRKRLGDYWDCGSFRGMLTASIAVVRFPEHADSVEAIITLLEFCIDLSKRNGKGQTVFSDAKTVGQMRRKNQIIDVLKRGLAQDIFEVYYQPIYSVNEDRFTMAEALIRLTDSELGAVSPAEFVPIAEDAGLIIDIGFMVLNKVCRFIRDLDERGVVYDAISVNLSSIQLNSDGLVDHLLEIIRKNRIYPRKLRMEITESVFVNEFEYMDKMIRRLSEYGIQFCLDDFGTGYSNIANVAELPFTIIKIDKSILYKSVISKKCFSIMNGLARTLSEVGMKIVVEGVETAEHRKLAEQINTDYMQGYLYARPMPADEAIRYLERSAL